MTLIISQPSICFWWTCHEVQRNMCTGLVQVLSQPVQISYLPRKQGHGQVLFFILRLFLIFHLWALSASEYFLFCIIPHQLFNKSSFTFPTFLIHSCIFLLNTVKPFFKQHWPSKRIPQGGTGWFCIRYEQLKARNNGGKCITFHTFTAKRFHSPTAEQV